MYMLRNANIYKVWSFSPPDDEFEDYRSASPASLPDHSMDYPQSRPQSRPHSAILPAPRLHDEGDVTMADIDTDETSA